ncbi:MAG: CDP-alcohol phosphatidyltransferase family protein [Acidisphaera sp.]|nr:CDP-alcohol phosphatidyltransferase family protein [Acidisphaera sp.]
MPDGTHLTEGAPARPADAGLLTLPNAITLARLCVVPVAVWLVLRHDLAIAFWLFVAAGASDAVDGWLARRGHSSAVGAVLDPMADKALLVSMYVTLATVHVLADWLAILVVFRDVVIVGGVLVLAVLGQPVAIRPLYVSKLNTALQIMLVATALLVAGFCPAEYALPPHWLAPSLLGALTWLVAASTLASGAAYVVHAARRG